MKVRLGGGGEHIKGGDLQESLNIPREAGRKMPFQITLQNKNVKRPSQVLTG